MLLWMEAYVGCTGLLLVAGVFFKDLISCGHLNSYREDTASNKFSSFFVPGSLYVNYVPCTAGLYVLKLAAFTFSCIIKR